MKPLIVFYSRTGFTKKIAFILKKMLKADIDEIKSGDRNGLIGYIKSGKESIIGNLPEISFKKNPEKYSLIIIGTPVWALDMASPVRSYLEKNKSKINKVAFFLTLHGIGAEKTFKSMQKIAGKPIAVLSVTNNEIKKNKFSDKIIDFCKHLK